ncbi:hypothetical protein PoB_005237500 [Plakobranchus ocellatus]|uniref:Frizzled/Smoothened transmembrane domain-containing protein n=1 Tax=Plakobranchus ocellatus TaxID=259542 RepID=A0AAV4BZN1_9GAST|nr:hypothetical protein PoB_005237500 [Plakobranchus ocellatus]
MVGFIYILALLRWVKDKYWNLSPEVSKCQSVLFALVLCTLTWLPAGQANWWTCARSCGRCVRRVTPMEELISQFYPGLFSLTPPMSIDPALEMTMYGSRTLNSGSAEIPSFVRNSNSLNNNGSSWHDDEPGGIDYNKSFRMTHIAHLRRQSIGCCETYV